ncbi:MAG: restriction endonuclease subunit S [Hydrogenophilales bacterium]|nr:restriction endonuclease subunit S [Hydrogenophilales bacterium]
MTPPFARLGDVSTLITKGTTPTTIGYPFVDEGIPFLRAEDINGGYVSVESAEKRISTECHKTLERSQLLAGDLLITIAGTVGRVGIAPTGEWSANCNQAVSIVRLKPEIFDLQFLCFFLRSGDVQHKFKQQGTTATITNVSLAQIRNLEVPLLPLPEQRRIVDILSRAEGIVRLRREAQRKAAELIPGIFLDMFGDPATNPKGWPMSTIGHLTSVQTGATPSRDNSAYYSDATIPWVKTGEVNGGIIPETEEMISQIALSETNCKVFPVGTILVAMYGQGQTRGRSAVLGIPAATNQACAAILPSNNIDGAFLFCFLQTQYEQLRGMAHGGNQANLNLSMIKGLPITLPPLSVQKVFSEKLDSVRSIQSQQDAATAKGEAIFNALLAGVFTTD